MFFKDPASKAPLRLVDSSIFLPDDRMDRDD
jgi:hypothetical protein